MLSYGTFLLSCRWREENEWKVIDLGDLSNLKEKRLKLRKKKKTVICLSIFMPVRH